MSFWLFLEELAMIYKRASKISPVLIFFTPFNSSPSLLLFMIENYTHCEPHSAIHLNFALSDLFFCIIQLLDENNYSNHVYFFYMLLVQQFSPYSNAGYTCFYYYYFLNMIYYIITVGVKKIIFICILFLEKLIYYCFSIIMIQQKQGRIHGYPNRMQVGRSSAGEGQLGIWARAVC